MELPDKALSILQPWAWLIIHGHKDIENREWKPYNPGLKFRGPVAIHTGMKADRFSIDDVMRGIHPVTGGPLVALEPRSFERGGIVGMAEIVDCIETSESDWFVGPYGFVIRNARPVPFIPVKGQLGFFNWKERRL